jgi:Kdo2-lipid IVA lauroyltransferase/acyltransferase
MPKNNFPWQDYLAPKFWPSWIGLAIMRILAILPYRSQLFVGKLIGEIFYRLARYRREITQTNIRLCFPELSNNEQEKLVRDNFHSSGISISETAISWWGKEKTLRKLVRFKNIEIINQCLKRGKGIILLGAHYTTLEISGRLFTLEHKFAGSYQKFKNRLFNHITQNAREQIFDQLFHRHEIRQTFRYIKQNNLVWIASDQDANADNCVFSPFFGHLASTQTVPSRIAKVTGAPIIPYISRRLDNGQGYELEFYQPLENFPGDSLEEDATRINKILEELIRKAPEQYLWMHRRFKTRPPGLPQIYPEKRKK